MMNKDKNESFRYLTIFVFAMLSICLIFFIVLKINEYMKHRDIESHYNKLVNLHKSNNIQEAKKEIKFFLYNNLINYKNVSGIKKDISILELDATLQRIDTTDKDDRCRIVKELYNLNPNKYEYNHENSICEEYDNQKKRDAVIMEKYKQDVRIKQWKAKTDEPIIHTTVDGSIACHSSSDLDDMVKYSFAKDYDSITVYMKTGKCISLKGGIKVTVLERPGGFGGGKVQFAYKGEKLWTTRDGIKF